MNYEKNYNNNRKTANTDYTFCYDLFCITLFSMSNHPLIMEIKTLKIWKDNRIDKEVNISYESLIKEYFTHKISNNEMPFERKFLLWLSFKNYAIETLSDNQWNKIYEAKNIYLNEISK